jgi:two-component system, OmpR family, phosphate regulon sensor histidine kinase PhoR
VAASLFGRSLGFLLAAVLAVALVFALVGLGVLDSVYSFANESSLLRAATALAASFPADSLGKMGAAAPGAGGASASPETARAAAFVDAATASGFRVSLILPDGRVLADSEAQASLMENHANRPEVASALRGLAASSRRRSTTLGVELIYAAAPIRARAQGARAEAGVVAVLRLALHRPGLELALAPARWTFALAAALFVLAAIGAAAIFGRMMARPLKALSAAARGYASGEREGSAAAAAALGPGAPEELKLLASTLDTMAGEIGSRMLEARARGRELEAILYAIAEAVLALDASLKITIANPAAAELFGLRGPEPAPGDGGPSPRASLGLLEATRSSALEAVAADCLSSGEARQAELSLFFPGERIFQAFAAPLGGPLAQGGSKPGGVVIVLNDITELRRLERVRRDFVANVSHELRTPVQLVKGFAESLSEGALEDADRARRFVSIISKNASRMENLIGDLLSLASLEREGKDWLRAEKKELLPILESALEALGPKAEARRTRLLLDCEEGLTARLDAGLLEQAVINLVDNAIKYSPPDSTVRLGARAEGPNLLIEVRDQGMGIPARDLPRLFERFYRVDKARSKELGGTGLGLAIVRHIALAHGGGVSVESWEGEGSTFRLSLPLG